MNIIKLKDVLMPEENPKATFFNTHLKGKYAWWVGMRYITPIVPEDIDQKVMPGSIGLGRAGYIKCEQDINNLLDPESEFHTQYIDTHDGDYNFLAEYADINETDYINNIAMFVSQNNYKTDDDITTDELKKFRTWLAEELLKFGQTISGERLESVYSNKVNHMLQYYAKNMTDDVVLGLIDFGAASVSILSTTTSKCGCVGSSNISSLYTDTLTNCDPLEVYRKNIYKLMVETFSSIDFWLDRYGQSKAFIGEFKKYIDNILRVGLPLNIDILADSRFTDCGCTQHVDSQGVKILTRLSEALGHIINESVDGHKNFIASAFADWSKYLYESMYWA